MAFHTDFRFVDYVDGKGERKPNPEPELIYGPVYSVGPLTVCAYALETADGLVVVDTGYASDGDLIPDNIRKLGLNPADIKLIINTHWHPDHAGGNARLVEISGATLAVHELDAEVVEAGRYKGGHKFPMEPVGRFSRATRRDSRTTSRHLSAWDTPESARTSAGRWRSCGAWSSTSTAAAILTRSFARCAPTVTPSFLARSGCSS